jgi:hypothetical protein
LLAQLALLVQATPVPQPDVHAAAPQTFAVPPPPQLWGAAHVPQFTVPPHPSGTKPQLSPAGQNVDGTQEQVPDPLQVPVPPQLVPAG